ncbi:MAG: glycerol-3-phosphate 1-O-acyltransferase PlsY [Clostridiales bacterium]|nr:glycerol-3-phosphate 1-O-acyltransferase PlsY [Clostridiales bacterium]
MSAVLAFILTAVLGYMLGCVNGAILSSHLFFHDDVRKHGSGNAGLTNFYRTYGAKFAPMVILCDMAKAALAILLSALLFHLAGMPTLYGKFWAGIFVVVGHMFPFRFHFKGGKGILCSGTLLLFLDWRIAVAGWGLFVLLWLLTRYVSLGSVAAAISFPISTWFVFGDVFMTACAAVIAAMILFAHRENIRRLLRGEERKFHFHLNPPKEGQS